MTYGHLQADCLYTRINSGPNARYRVWETFTFTFNMHKQLMPRLWLNDTVNIRPFSDGVMNNQLMHHQQLNNN